MFNLYLNYLYYFCKVYIFLFCLEFILLLGLNGVSYVTLEFIRMRRFLVEFFDNLSFSFIRVNSFLFWAYLVLLRVLGISRNRLISCREVLMLYL